MANPTQISFIRSAGLDENMLDLLFFFLGGGTLPTNGGVWGARVRPPPPAHISRGRFPIEHLGKCGFGARGSGVSFLL